MTKDLRNAVISALDSAAGVLNVPDFARKLMGGQDLELARIEMDSMTMMGTIMHLEDKLGLDINVDEIAGQSTVNGLIGYLQKRLDVVG